MEIAKKQPLIAFRAIPVVIIGAYMIVAMYAMGLVAFISGSELPGKPFLGILTVTFAFFLAFFEVVRRRCEEAYLEWALRKERAPDRIRAGRWALPQRVLSLFVIALAAAHVACVWLSFWEDRRILLVAMPGFALLYAAHATYELGARIACGSEPNIVAPTDTRVMGVDETNSDRDGKSAAWLGTT